MAPMTMTPTSATPAAPQSSLSSLNLDLSFGSTPKAPQSSFGSFNSTSSVSDGGGGGRPHDWSIKPANRLKWNQEFNRADHRKTGYLEAHVARPFLLQSGLPQLSLAKIWELADQDKDGRLSSGEFVSAMALCEAASRGTPIPESLPAELGKSGASMSMSKPAQQEQGGRLGLEEERRRNMEKE